MPIPGNIPTSAPSVAAWITGAREALGLTQHHFGKRVGAHWTSVSKWENGHTQPGRKTIKQIEALLRERDAGEGAAGAPPLSAEAIDRWQSALHSAYFGEAPDHPITEAEFDAVRRSVADGPAPDADKLDAARDDLGDAIGLLIALNTFLASDGTDRGRSIAAIGRVALEKVRRHYAALADAGEARS